MSKQLSRDTRRAAIVRVVANAALVLLAYEVVAIGNATAWMLAGETPPAPPAQLVLLLTVFIFARWIFVLPGLLFVLVGLELVARRVPHARVLTAIIAFVPMVLWELTNSPGDFSIESSILGVTAVLFAGFARLPARRLRGSTVDIGAPHSPPEPAIAPR